MNRVLVVEDKESLARMLQETLEADGFAADVAASGDEAIRRLTAGGRYAAIVTDLRLPGRDGIEVLRHARETDPDCPVIVMTAYGTIETAVEAMKLGARDFVQKPIDPDHLILLLRRCRDERDMRLENLLLKEEFQKRMGVPAIISDAPEMRAISAQIQKVAQTDSAVLLQGESGTGKELFARAIHQLSPRRNRAFVAINCAAIPDTLIENELFGHEKGAYTGASGRQLGKFELADGGTIFLDEIGELGIGVQSKILRVLQEHRFERVGGTATIDVDIRVICATNRDLQQQVREGRFREDLFFRVHVFPLTIPPLRSRREDIDPLTDHFVQKFSRELGKELRVSAEARQVLRSYEWPGNIRELENCIERAVILCDGPEIEPADLNVVVAAEDAEGRLRQAIDLTGSLGEVAARAVSLAERTKIRAVLRESSGRAEAAERLGITPRTLANKMKELGIEDGGRP